MFFRLFFIFLLYQQVEIAIEQMDKKSTPLEKYIHLHTIQDSDETLYYAILAKHTKKVCIICYLLVNNFLRLVCRRLHYVRMYCNLPIPYVLRQRFSLALYRQLSYFLYAHRLCPLFTPRQWVRHARNGVASTDTHLEACTSA